MQPVLRRSGLLLFALLGVFYIAFGVFYASVTDVLFFHAAAAPKESLEAVRPLYFALMKLVGGGTIALGALGLFVTFSSARAGAPASGPALFAAYTIPLFMAAYVAERLAAATGSPTSWHIMGGLFAVNAAALAAVSIGRREA
jgi:hypothetical protein